MHRRRQILFATTVLTALVASPAAALTDPYSEASATAVEVDGLVAVAKTSASTQDEGSASATVLEIGGETVVGGSQEGPGENAGEIVTTGEDNEQGHVTIGNHRATVEPDRSDARAAVVDANLGGEGGVSVTLLESRSTATEERSDAQTTGAIVDVGGGQLRLEVLHANTSSTGEGGAHVLGINGERILTSEQVDGQCEIPADPVLHLLCLYANAVTGEDGVTGGGAGVVDLTALDDNLTGRAFDTTAGAGPGQEQEVSPPGVPAGDPRPAPTPDDAPPAGPLPRTGGGLAASLLGLLAMGAGEALRRFKR